MKITIRDVVMGAIVLLFIYGMVELHTKGAEGSPIVGQAKENPPKKLPRGVRNNNPGNIKKGNDWIGEAKVCKDKMFECFSEPQYGGRALILLLSTYIDRHDLTTINGIIHRYAPPSENDTNAYIRFVEQYMQMCRHAIIIDFVDVIRLANAISVYENGGEYYPAAFWIDSITYL